MDTSLILAFVVGLIAGAALLWLILLGKLKQSTHITAEHQALLTTEKTTNAALQTTVQTQASQLLEYKQALEQAQNIASELNARCAVAESQTDAQAKLSDVFKALSAEALSKNNDSFISLAKTQLQTFQQGAEHDLEKRQKSIDELVKPLKEGLENVDKKVQELDKNIIRTDATFNEQVKNLFTMQTNLVNALRTPRIRGVWGEVLLREVVEMVGMLEHCHFSEQKGLQSEEGQLRPDVTIHLPGNRNVVVDSKVPLEAYWKAIETTDDGETRQNYFKEHARQVRSHLSNLSSKAYWKEFDNSPEFVILFLPAESFHYAALEHDPELIRAGWDQKVLIATPTTLIALLRAVAYGWSQERLSRNTEEISNLGKKLYARIRTFAEHMTSLRTNLQRAVDSHNKAVGSLESKVLPSARSLKDLSSASDDDIEIIDPIEVTTRPIQSNELLLPGISIDVDPATF